MSTHLIQTYNYTVSRTGEGGPDFRATTSREVKFTTEGVAKLLEGRSLMVVPDTEIREVLKSIGLWTEYYRGPGRLFGNTCIKRISADTLLVDTFECCDT